MLITQLVFVRLIPNLRSVHRESVSAWILVQLGEDTVENGSVLLADLHHLARIE